MEAEFTTEFNITGSKEELKQIIKTYSNFNAKEHEADFTQTTIKAGAKKIKLDDLTDEKALDDFLSTVHGKLEVKADGPYGGFAVLADIEFFEKLADAAPGASFSGWITGGTSYSEERMMAELKNGTLHINSYYESYEEDNEGDGTYDEYDYHPVAQRIEPLDKGDESNAPRDFYNGSIRCVEDTAMLVIEDIRITSAITAEDLKENGFISETAYKEIDQNEEEYQYDAKKPVMIWGEYWQVVFYFECGEYCETYLSLVDSKSEEQDLVVIKTLFKTTFGDVKKSGPSSYVFENNKNIKLRNYGSGWRIGIFAE